jgi:hypothetical protein
VAAGQQQIGRHGVRDLAAQAHRRPSQRVDAPAHLRHAEAGARAGDADVGRLQDLGAARDRRALDRGDERLVQQESFEQRLDDPGRHLGDGQVRRVACVGAVARGGGGASPRPAVRRLGERVAGGGLGHRGKVGAGAERPAGTGEDHDPHVRVGVGLVPRTGHAAHHLGRQCVAALGPVHRHDHHAAVALHEQVPAVLPRRHGQK